MPLVIINNYNKTEIRIISYNNKHYNKTVISKCQLLY